MLRRLATALWGNFESSDEIKKFFFLAGVFGLIIGTYWTLRPLKDGIFNAIIGMDFQPYAKILSVIVVFPLVIGYSKLIDMFPRHKVFYGLIVFYAAVAFVLTYFLLSPEFGLLNTEKSPWRMLGWFWYVYVESFGSLIVALFWAFTADSTLPESAKRGFPIIALFGQIGNMVGPFVFNAKRLGFTTSAPVLGICGILMLFTGLMLWAMLRIVPASQFVSYGEQAKREGEEEPGFLEGLRLLVTQPYLLGIFAIVTIYEIIVTIIDFHFKSTAAVLYLNEADLSSYLSTYATMTGLVSMLCVLFGINNIQRKLGMRASLLLLPVLICVAVLLVKIYPTWLMLAFVIMVFSKAVNYALNQPTLKQLYIPTTKETRYKAQAWIEMFGSRGAKAGSSGVNAFRATFKSKFGAIAGVNAFLTLSSIISGGFIFVWLIAAFYIANKFTKALEKNEVVC